jgi:nitroreductase
MDFKQVVGNRRSIRYYQAWRDVERSKIQTILEAGRLAFRGVNASFAKAVVVYRDEVKEEQREALKDPTTTAQLDMAPVWIMWFGDLTAVETACERGTLKELVDVGALPPSHGWSHRYVDSVVIPQVLKPIMDDPTINLVLTAREAFAAVAFSVLAAVDEGLGTMLTSMNPPAAKELVGAPDNWLFLVNQLVGYSAEAIEAGQRPREPFEVDFFEMRADRPYTRDADVVAQLRQAGMIQDSGVAEWKRNENRALARMYGLPE